MGTTGVVHKFTLTVASRRVNGATFKKGQSITLPMGSPAVAAMKADKAWKHTVTQAVEGRREGPPPISQEANAAFTALKSRIGASAQEIAALPHETREQLRQVLVENGFKLLGDLLEIGIHELGDLIEGLLAGWKEKALEKRRRKRNEDTKAEARRLARLAMVLDDDGDGIPNALDTDNDQGREPAVTPAPVSSTPAPAAPTASTPVTPAATPTPSTPSSPPAPATPTRKPSTIGLINASGADDGSEATAKPAAPKKPTPEERIKAAKEANEGADAEVARPILVEMLDDETATMKDLLKFAQLAKVGEPKALRDIRGRAALVTELRKLLAPPPADPDGPPSPSDLS